MVPGCADKLHTCLAVRWPGAENMALHFVSVDVWGDTEHPCYVPRALAGCLGKVCLFRKARLLVDILPFHMSTSPMTMLLWLKG